MKKFILNKKRCHIEWWLTSQSNTRVLLERELNIFARIMARLMGFHLVVIK